jgi:hypothetical protein
MNNNLQKAKKLLKNSNYTCVLCRGDDILTSDLSGIAPMMNFIKFGLDLRGYSAADRIVGKATALLFVLAGIREVYSGVISDGAVAVLEEHGILYEYAKRVEFITNRAGTGICPMEATVKDIDDPAVAYKALSARIKEMSAK